MSPHRVVNPEVQAALAAILYALTSAAFGLHGFFVACTVVVMILNIMLGMERATVNDGEGWEEHRAMAGLFRMLRRLALILLAFAMDAVAMTLAHLVGNDTAVAAASGCWATLAATAALFVVVGRSALENVARTDKEAGAVVGVLVAMLDILVRLDFSRLRSLLSEALQPAPTPAAQAKEER
jgi:hypothetical protein